MMEDQNRVKPPAADAEAMDRLRDRTDELELIISSLTIFALFSLPGWWFEKMADVYTHLSTSLVIAGTLGTALLAGACYGLAACFVVHLMARAYWVGLIGLRTVFPRGINWEKTPGLGPVSRQYYRDTLPDLETVIAKTDKLASSLFAVISMLTLSVLWFGTILVVVLAAAGLAGSQFGFTNAAIVIASLALATLFLGIPLLLYILDGLLAARFRGLRESPAFATLVRMMRRIASIAYPQRLVLPVQLTLQSNTRPFIFFVALATSVIAIVVIGNIQAAAWTRFTLSGEFTYLDDTRIEQGFRSIHYEDMFSSSLDHLRAWPRIDSFRQSGSFVRLFLPYQPLRDNLVLDALCGSASEALDTVDCLRGLWQVRIDGQPVPMADFLPAERADLGMRGLIGLAPLAGLKPGLHQIEVIWNPGTDEETTLIDDRYTEVKRRYLIPIAFSPDFERALE
jgi:hypothetical protein